jgi:hypothetical protein
MRTIEYTVYDSAGEELKVDTVNNFFLEISGLIVHDVVAPFAVARQFFKLGHVGGGMSPGVEWEPFEITEEEYQDILNDILKRSRQGSLPGPHGTKIENVIMDKDFDHYTEWIEWIKDVTKKYTGRIIEIRED